MNTATLDTTTCPKCRGSGVFKGYSGRVFGNCFPCNGTGRIATGPAVSVDKLMQAFEHAVSKGIKRPKMRIGDDLMMSLAPARGNNPGAIYVKGPKREFNTDDEDQRPYLGKVVNGQFIASRECTMADAFDVRAALAEPLLSAIAYGRRTGNCAICGRELTVTESIERGIGPICAERFGF